MKERPHGWHDRITAQLIEKVGRDFPEESKRFWNCCERPGSFALAEIGPTFVGFIDVYFFLSQIIPEDRIVFDLGCSYAMQSYYFRNHRGYIGVDGWEIEERLRLPNVRHVQKYVATKEDLQAIHDQFVTPLGVPTFAICSYVPSPNLTRLMKEVFTDCFSYYPRSQPGSEFFPKRVKP